MSNFVNRTDLPLVGSVANASQANSLCQCIYNTDDALVAGDPVVALAAQAGANKYEMGGTNPINFSITKKATTVTGGAGTTDACGFCIVNSTDKPLPAGGFGVPYKGQMALFAPLGSGAMVWLEVHQDNVSDLQANLDANQQVTLDTTNGGIKKGSAGDALAGAKIMSNVVNGQKLVKEGEIYTIKPCNAILIKLG